MSTREKGWWWTFFLAFLLSKKKGILSHVQRTQVTLLGSNNNNIEANVLTALNDYLGLAWIKVDSQSF